MTTTRPINDLITIVNDQQDVEERVYKLAECITKNYNLRGYTSDLNVTVTKGRKYFKIVCDNSVNCFVDVNNGDVYKPASWNKPAKHVRYNLLDNPEIVYERCDWAGSYLYLR
tara:strand:- start:693 stop:1031 length:339 start_codon:yes stop_codon:yes gene_type:complete